MWSMFLYSFVYVLVDIYGACGVLADVIKTRDETNKLQLLLLLFMVISNVVVDQA